MMSLSLPACRRQRYKAFRARLQNIVGVAEKAHAPGTGEMPRIPIRCCRGQKPAKSAASTFSVAAG
jgi:outer membrane receptor for Fe3+-dicitrate